MDTKALVLGGNGMLGSAVVKALGKSDLTLRVTARGPVSGLSATRFRRFSIGDGDLRALVSDLGPGDFVVNCIGVIKQRMNESVPDDRLRAIEVNSAFPYALSRLAESQGFRVIQIATDCVFSGDRGSYLESSAHDAGDVYGQSKSLGEVPGEHFLNLRCSIIGPEPAGSASLVGWLLSQPQGATINGYTDHIWNGVTTDAFARIAAGLIESDSLLSGTFHVVPADTMDKSTLSGLILDVFDRPDVSVVPIVTGTGVDRTLATAFPAQNAAIWALGGYETPPTIAEMVRDLAGS